MLVEGCCYAVRRLLDFRLYVAMFSSAVKYINVSEEWSTLTWDIQHPSVGSHNSLISCFILLFVCQSIIHFVTLLHSSSRICGSIVRDNKVARIRLHYNKSS